MVPWAFALSALSVILIVTTVQLVYASMQLGSNRSWHREWGAWQTHKTLTAPARRDAALAAEQVRQIAGSGPEVLATRLVGSASTGALQPTSDVDVRVFARDCDAQKVVGARLQAAGFTFERAHGSYKLYRGTSPGGKQVDVAVDTTAYLPGPTTRDLENRGFLEFVLRRTNPALTVRQVSNDTASPPP